MRAEPKPRIAVALHDPIPAMRWKLLTWKGVRPDPQPQAMQSLYVPLRRSVACSHRLCCCPSLSVVGNRCRLLPNVASWGGSVANSGNSVANRGTRGSAGPNRLNAMISRINLSPIRDLRFEKPITMAGQLRRAWADIKAAIDAGHSLKTIAERLRDCGIDVRYRALTVYVSRLRREDSSGRSPAPTQAKTAAAGRKRKPGPAAVFDPLRNVKEREENRPGFQFDPEPDPRKLI